jgi:hypothetical protein
MLLRLKFGSDRKEYAAHILMREVMDAVKRENLPVTTVFAMHPEPVTWTQVAALVEKR